MQKLPNSSRRSKTQNCTLVLEVCQLNRGQDPRGEHSGQGCGVSGREHGVDDAGGVHVGGGGPSATNCAQGSRDHGLLNGSNQSLGVRHRESSGADGSSSASARRSSSCRGGGRRCRAWWRHNLKFNLKHHIIAYC